MYFSFGFSSLMQIYGENGEVFLECGPSQMKEGCWYVAVDCTCSITYFKSDLVKNKNK